MSAPPAGNSGPVSAQAVGNRSNRSGRTSDGVGLLAALRLADDVEAPGHRAGSTSVKALTRPSMTTSLSSCGWRDGRARPWRPTTPTPLVSALLSRRPLRRVTLADLYAFDRRLEAQELSLAARARGLASIKSLLSFGHRIGVFPINAGTDFKVVPPPDRLAERRLSPDAQHALLTAVARSWDRTLIHLLLATGIRVSEVVALTWADLEPVAEAGQVRVVDNRNVERVLPLPADLWRESARPPVAAQTPSRFSRSATTGGRMRRQEVNALVRRAAAEAGLGLGVSPSWLRHAYAWNALAEGSTLAEVQTSLGHRHLQATRRYRRAAADQDRVME